MKLSAILSVIAFASVSVAQTAATIPITLDHNRVIIDVRLPMPDGTVTRVRAWVNNGTKEMTITEHLAKKLGLTVANGMTTAPQQFYFGALVFTQTQIKQARVVAAESVAPGLSPEITLPAPFLHDRDLLIDYPSREFSIGPSGSIKFKGTAVKANTDNGQLQLTAEFADEKQNMNLDFGSSFTQLPSDVIAKLSRANSQWPHMTGAISTANQWGSDDEVQATLLRLPSLNLGSVSEKSVVVSSNTKATGVLGANCLLAYRVGVDNRNSTVYFDRVSTTPVPEMDVVGLTLLPRDDGKYIVAGIAEWNGKPAVPDVKAGDILVKIDNIDTAGGTMGQAWSLLGGAPGDPRELALSRDGKQFTVKATVQRFLNVSKPANKAREERLKETGSKANEASGAISFRQIPKLRASPSSAHPDSQ